MNSKILLIDDEISVCRFLRFSLESHGYLVEEAHNGNEGLQKIVEWKPDLVLLDFGLPDILGIEVLKKMREWNKTPVIFLTVRDSDEDKVAALDGGADDYLTKPFSVLELLARVRVALRHAQIEDSIPIFRTGLLEMDRAAHSVKVGNQEVKLTATEYALLCLLAKHAGKMVPHRIILKEVWGPNMVEHNHYLRVYFGQIRKKLDHGFPGSGDLIENEAGLGYRLRIE
ncbi:MAG: response regulator transcription factor [Bdellovibrionales bacterium]|nr:response regulator transcription factor [Bdellovibrionales bacterium]